MKQKPQPFYKSLHMECACHSPEHTLHFVLDGAENEIHTEVYLNQYRGFFKRLWIAFKYVCGYQCRFGHFDCYTMNGFGGLEQAKKLHKMLTLWIEDAERRLAEFTNKILSHEEQKVLDQLVDKVQQAQPCCPTCRIDPSQGPTKGCSDPLGCGYWRGFLEWYAENEEHLTQLRKLIDHEQDV